MRADFWEPRRCLREPIGEIFHAAMLLDLATGAHLAGDRAAAEKFIRQADMPEVRDWTESLWGSEKANPDQVRYRRYRQVPAAPRRSEGTEQRMPTAAEKKALIMRYGQHCVFCGIPLIRKEVRNAMNREYPEAARWGSTNLSQHAALQCMWLQFDHVIPHSHGGDNSPDNVVVTCAACNYGRGDNILDELGLIDPRTRPVYKTSWDGLERFLTTSVAPT